MPKDGANGLQPRNFRVTKNPAHSRGGLSFTYYQVIRLSLIVICGLLFIGFATKNWFSLYLNLLYDNMWFQDFFALWSYANFEFLRPVLEIYNNDIMLEYQMDLGACPKCVLPYAYPPFFLLYIIPIGIPPYIGAYLIWALGSVMLYLIASLYKHLRLYAAFLILFAPATITCFATGQTGLL